MPNRVREWMVRIVLITIGVLTATPVLSLVSPAQLESYGVVDPDVIVLTLLQHRGVLQLLLGAALVWAAFRPDVRVAVAIAAVVSKGAFLALILSRPEARAESSAVAMVFDPISIVLLGVLLIDIGVRARRRRTEPVAA